MLVEKQISGDERAKDAGKYFCVCAKKTPRLFTLSTICLRAVTRPAHDP